MRIVLGPLADFPVEAPTPVKVDGTTYLVVRRASAPEEPCVLLDKCPHMGLSLSKGPSGGYRDGVITCPWHNSQFAVCSGENIEWAPGFAGRKAPGWARGLVSMGRKPAPLTMFDTAVEDGQVVIDA